MSWRVVCASEVGTSHTETGTPCQDSCWAQVGATADGLPFLSVFVTDGAGSAAMGGEGAELAIQAAATFVEEQLRMREFALNDEVATACLMAVRNRIYAEADNRGLKARDFACTFIAVLSFAHGTLAFQVGDGGVALDVGSGLHVPIAPMSGEYANMTHFVTDEDAVSVMASKSYSETAMRVAVFSDGIQRLALNMANNTPHEPFFAPFFRVMSQAKVEQEEQMTGALAKFLNSSAVNERTDDDKTLALAVLTA